MKFQTKRTICLGLFIYSILLFGTAHADLEDARALANAKITLVQAIQAAEGVQNGVAFEAQIDDDSVLPAFEVSILLDDRIYEVQVDAVSGDVLSIHEDRDD